MVKKEVEVKICYKEDAVKKNLEKFIVKGFETCGYRIVKKA